MKNKDLYSYKRILDMLTGEYVDEAMPTDLLLVIYGLGNPLP